MKIIITGATSFIGVAIIRRLAKQPGNYIWAVIRPNSVNRKKIPIYENVSVIELDMMQIENLDTYIRDNEIDVFYHLAWEGVRAPYRDDKLIQEKNYEAAMKAIHVCKKLNVKKFIGCGSQAEYGYMNGRITEEYPCNPATEYGKYKYRASREIEKYALENHIDFVWGRIFSIYGPEDYEKSLVMMCIKKMKNNEAVALTECTQNWDFLYIEDVAEVFAELAEKRCASGVYNIASGEYHELKYYIEIIKKVLNSKSALNYGELPYPKSGKVSFIPDVTKIQESLGWGAEKKFEMGILEIVRGKTNEENKCSCTNI